MHFMTELPVLTNWKSKSYDSILVIADRLTKIVYYNSEKITINAPDLAEVIIDVVVRHYSFFIISSLIKAPYSRQNSGSCYVISWE